MEKNDESEDFVVLKNCCNISNDIQTDCAVIKNILLSICEGKISFLKEAYPLTLEYRNRELIMKENDMVISKLPFEIIYFDIKKNHLDTLKYEEAIKKLLSEEVEKAISQKYA